AHRHFFLQRLAAPHVAETAGDHDGLVVTARPRSVERLLEAAEVAGNAGPAKFIVEGRRTQRPLDHDVQRADDAVRLADALLPGLLETGNTQVGNRVAHQT